MTHPITTLIQARTSTNYYDPSRPVSQETATELVRLATLAPSAYNFQNWKFIAVRSTEARERLKSVAYGQQKVVDAPLTFIVCGTLAAHTQLARALQPSLDAGIVDGATVDTWVGSATSSHDGNPQLQRDEAVRSASLAAMTLMLAAEGMGLSTCPMSGFDGAALAGAFELDALTVPVMLITVGYPMGGNWAQKLRKPVADVLAFA